MAGRIARWLLALGCLATLPLQAATRAWLDRDRIAFGETATLNIEVAPAPSDPTAGPDYGPLLGEFDVSGQTMRRQVAVINGRSQSQLLHAVALRPLRSGVIGIPSLAVGGSTTSPLTLTVVPADAAVAQAGQGVFIITETDDRTPYVQQAVGLTVRLHYSVPLISGQLDLDAPEGTSLQRIGEDMQTSRDIGGRRYTVVERRYLLIPERSGGLTVPGPRFSGRGAGGWIEEMLGGNGRELQAVGAPRRLQVRPIPANAPQPWLPLRDLRLRYLSVPSSARAGEASSMAIEAIADGATAAQMPELQLPNIAGVQVFPEPVQTEERFVDGRPRVVLSRRFSLVPMQPGRLSLPGARMDWWDVRSSRARQATLPAITLEVAPGAGAFAGAADASNAAQPVPRRSLRGFLLRAGAAWPLLALAFAAACLLTLAWALRRRAVRSVPRPRDAVDVALPPGGTRSLRRALDAGDPGDILDALAAMAPPQAANTGNPAELMRRLENAGQRDAVAALERARWGDGDPVAARALARESFAHGPRWRDAGAQDPATRLLPPLYPR